MKISCCGAAAADASVVVVVATVAVVVVAIHAHDKYGCELQFQVLYHIT